MLSFPTSTQLGFATHGHTRRTHHLRHNDDEWGYEDRYELPPLPRPQGAPHFARRGTHKSSCQRRRYVLRACGAFAFVFFLLVGVDYAYLPFARNSSPAL